MNFSNFTIPSYEWGSAQWMSYCDYYGRLAVQEAVNSDLQMFIVGFAVSSLFYVMLLYLRIYWRKKRK